MCYLATVLNRRKTSKIAKGGFAMPFISILSAVFVFYACPFQRCCMNTAFTDDATTQQPRALVKFSQMTRCKLSYLAICIMKHTPSHPPPPPPTAACSASNLVFHSLKFSGVTMVPIARMAARLASSSAATRRAACSGVSCCVSAARPDNHALQQEATTHGNNEGAYES